MKAEEEIKYPLILDGGMSNVLESLGCNLDHPLWSAYLIVKKPEMIVKAHLAYLNAGSKCITTSSYQATIEGFERIGLTRSESEAMLLRSVELAEEARRIFLKENSEGNRIYLAASIGPYGAFLADGSEYKGKYDISDQRLKEFHTEKVSILEETTVDFLAFETIPSFREFKILNEIISDCKKPCWLSFSCRNEHSLNDGNSIIDAVKSISSNKNLFALGINCTAPRYISDIIKNILPFIQDKKLIIYPNSGEIYLPETKSWKGISDPVTFQKMASEWLSSGVDIIGGCCRIGPDHIKQLTTL